MYVKMYIECVKITRILFTWPSAKSLLFVPLLVPVVVSVAIVAIVDSSILSSVGFCQC